jgi:dipeptidyl aminopeptidase/acylaminoacyl peptidase
LWNWYTKELVNYQLRDGRWNKGILYKPENFDPNKKYPILFHFYEILSDQFYIFFPPRIATGSINPAFMCSQGYLVFQPDIPLKFREPGECAYDAVISAVNYLTKYNWVDSTKMGLSGSSHGAYSVNYILTKTQKFAAAAPAFGMVDEISGYNALRSGGSRQWAAETNQERMGGTLWENPEVYIRNSPIFKADKVTTPVLILHNKNDDAVPWAQGVEWYLALRRTGKKVWMLQYDNEEHGVFLEKNGIDYTSRLEQFFGYYLKGDYPPVWMTQGIPASEKGKDQGFSPDPYSAP